MLRERLSRMPRTVVLALLAAGMAGAVSAAEPEGDVLARIAGSGVVVDFTKLDADGRPLEDQEAVYTITPWDCVRDDVTGLMWEVKTATGRLRDAGHTYTWYHPDRDDNGGLPGTADGGECEGDTDCDTRAYVEAVNEAGLCGFSDWRMPTRSELRTIVDYESRFPAIDAGIFPNTVATSFWTAEAHPDRPTLAWHTDFKFGLASYYFFKSGPKAVRLVRDAE